MSSSIQAVPNFFIAGAPKAGTTSLYHWLAAHPQVYMSPIKEPSYFSLEARPEICAPEFQANIRRQMRELKSTLRSGLGQSLRQSFVEEWEGYLRLFTGVSNEIAIGEASVMYLWSKTAARRIAERLPHARILLILRDPAERAFSQYLSLVAHGHVSTSFREHVLASRNPGDKINRYYPFLQMGLYAESLGRYFADFPRKQIRIWLYEDTLAQPQVFHRQVMEFLNIDPNFVPDVSKRRNEALVPKLLGITRYMRRTGAWGRLRDTIPAPLRPLLRKVVYRRSSKMQLSAEDRSFLFEYYRDDIHRLQQLLDRDLSGWLR